MFDKIKIKLLEKLNTAHEETQKLKDQKIAHLEDIIRKKDDQIDDLINLLEESVEQTKELHTTIIEQEAKDLDRNSFH